MNAELKIVLKSFSIIKQPFNFLSFSGTDKQTKDGSISSHGVSEVFLKQTDAESKLPFSFLGLPKANTLYTILRSPHIDKKSREQYGMKVHKQLLVINTKTHRLREDLFNLKFENLNGVQMKAIFRYRTRLQLKRGLV